MVAWVAVFRFSREESGISWKFTDSVGPFGLFAGDQYGYSVQLRGTTLVASAPGDSQFPNPAGSGIIYRCEQDPEASTFTYISSLLVDDGFGGNAFAGSSLHLEDDLVIIGAPGDLDTGTALIYDLSPELICNPDGTCSCLPGYTGFMCE